MWGSSQGKSPCLSFQVWLCSQCVKQYFTFSVQSPRVCFLNYKLPFEEDVYLSLYCYIEIMLALRNNMHTHKYTSFIKGFTLSALWICVVPCGSFWNVQLVLYRKCYASRMRNSLCKKGETILTTDADGTLRTMTVRWICIGNTRQQDLTTTW